MGSSAIPSSSAPPLDVAAVRERFPALASGAAYLDGPGGSQCPREVLDAVAACMERSNANLGGAFPTSADSDEVMARGRPAAAHGAGALAWADGVHFAPHRRLRARGWGIDVLLCSPYKFFGPHWGIAAIRPDLAESLPADRVRPAH